MTTRTEASTTEPETIQLDISLISPSPRNPRRDVGDVSELAASMKSEGLLQPIVVRPIGEAFESAYEVVAGHRRIAGAMLNEWKTISSKVIPLDDTEALRFAIVENLHRKDLHPMEEGEAFEILHDSKMTIEEIAARLHKSTGYVAQRLSLLRLPKSAREAFKDGTIEVRTALAIARIPNQDIRAKATKDALETLQVFGNRLGMDSDEQLDVRLDHATVVKMITSKYTLNLKTADFARNDPDLLAGAGTCGDCPKRSGNDRDLFGDIVGEDVCLDPDCFSAKIDASWSKYVDTATKNGHEVLTAAASKKVFYAQGSIDESSGYVDPTGNAGSIQKWDKTWKQLLPKDHGLKPVIARGPDGTKHELFRKKEILALIGKKGEKAKGADEHDGAAAAKAIETEKYRRELGRKLDLKLREEIILAVEGSNVSEKKFLRAIVDGYLDDYTAQAVMSELKLKRKDVEEETNVSRLRRLVMSFMIGSIGSNELARKTLRAIASGLAIDSKKIEKQIADEMKAVKAEKRRVRASILRGRS